MAAGPFWFLGVDALFDVIFALVCGIVSLLAYRAYRFFRQRKYLMHTTGFFLLALGYLALAASNLVIAAQEGKVYVLSDAIRIIQAADMLSDISALLFVVGLGILLLLYLQIKDVIAQGILALLVMFCLALTWTQEWLIHLLLAIMFLAIIARLTVVHKTNKNVRAVLLGFIGIFVGEMLFTTLRLHPLLYVAAHIVTLAGFISIAWGMRR